ncbi:NAD-dependent succinate-semialdehyde dehydrogenase [Natronospira sp. AB-CW4]|uniref:NAD-dependent succinate-semialdehyde dehydrogenase n=1 Tax=Natronospira bacteriovora TaxID=3069753 RepID=A0ABU0W8E7_9GAMM|nr:NAD-dependent succinate-semialdehyde dehydrogenase [Natronospira sp. AB-CW4]MDQ2070276.1 NAD-dependent succinate-semialdehyde dehydrogenase [Natronospira sp. AB-CW4]
MRSINPASEEDVDVINAWDGPAIEQALEKTALAAAAWADLSIDRRTELLGKLGDLLRRHRDECAELITREMGKCIAEARTEIEKCAWLCDYYADTAAQGLADEVVHTDARRSYVHYAPLGTVLGIMPWNFPFWQVIRFAAPAVTAGNTALLKHAGNVPGCARKLESLFRGAGYPEGVFLHLPVETEQVRAIIEDERVHAVTLTGSERAGSVVAAQAGRALKKTVLELGGSDAFIVLDDADLAEAVQWGVKARFQANGQSCIAAKRFILDERIADSFLERFKAAAAELRMGDPMDEATTLGPMARRDLRDELHAQVEDALAQGAEAVLGCERPSGRGWYYPASILDGIRPGMRAWSEELFGPVATVIRVANDQEALAVANDSPFGLGGSIWTRDLARGERLALKLASGGAYVNAMTKSDPRTPFGGIKRSGYGRELGVFGLREFVNIRTVWMA